MARIRVLVVDDSAFMRKLIADRLSSDPGIEVAGTASNGREALERIEELQPDVVTMDVTMPGMDGLTALKTIMQTRPVPVVMLSNLTSEGADATMKALELGAVDFVAKPSAQISLDIAGSSHDIVNKVKIAAGTRGSLKKISLRKAYVPEPSPRTVSGLEASLNKLVLIGTSTGGPKALHQVIPKLPGHINAAILIVQHMPAGFTRSLAERLDQVSAVKVKEAEPGEKILPGCAYVAPGDYHLKVAAAAQWGKRDLLVKLDQSPPLHGCRPAFDVLLASAAEQFWSHMVCVIMTGMGHDGAAGLLKVRAKKARTIAEHQSSCVVYGMPKAAVETGQVDFVVPLPEIPGAIMKLL